MLVYFRRFFTCAAKFKAQRLDDRCLLSLRGPDVLSYLQGLITNDAFLLNQRKSLYAFFLNNKGRVLYDVLLFANDDDELYLECDALAKEDLLQHLKMYRVRRKVDVDASDHVVWAVFGEGSNLANIDDILSVDKAYRDPRLPSLGFRVIRKSREKLKIDGIPETKDYVNFRYKLGVAEGLAEIPLGSSFPLEYNLDYLDGVSFRKGCYVGQELTARTRHTGVVRKRIMPFTVVHSDGSSDVSWPSDTPVKKDGKSVGKLRGLRGKEGIALMRIAEVSSELQIEGVPIRVERPEWWPK